MAKSGQSTPVTINSPFSLPCGVVLHNRLVKAAMTERISNWKLEPTEDHERLYERWSKTGAGLLITGNVLFDRKHLESGGNVLFSEACLPQLRRWAAAGKKHGNHLWVQISHAGRQTNRFTNWRPLAPSEVQLQKLALFGKPRAMTESDIQEVIKGFVRTAQLAKEAGFDGVQIHSAHGYLLSQFLSPLTNLRTDQWGGSLENRSRLLRTIIREVRQAVGAGFPISVKLNSSDFQRGGLTEEESLEVVKLLEDEKIDLLEISGGTYENVAFFLKNEEEVQMKESTRQREAYFMEFAQKIRSVSKIPIMITGGFRSFDYCNEALYNQELDLIGMARPFLTNLVEIPGFLEGEVPHLRNLIHRTGIKQFEDAAEGGYYARQLIQISKGQKARMKMNALWSSVFLIVHEFRKALGRKMRI
jgi:2,4-dienoyl-CoA reductase-like NADH-dependent reductase (Old Yellow Enzyme family)